MRVINIESYAGDDLSIVLSLTKDGAAVDLTGAVVVAQARPYPNSDQVVNFNVDTASKPGSIGLSLGGSQTALLTRYSAWDCRVRWSDGRVETVVKGQIFTYSSVSEPA